MQNRINFGLKYPNNIKDLAAHCRIIYNQILVTNWVQSNTKPVNTKVANTSTRFILSTRFVPFLSQTTSLSISSYCLKPGNIFSPFTNEEWLKLMKERRCYYCQQPGYTTANWPRNIIKKTLIAEIAGTTINNSKILGKK